MRECPIFFSCMALWYDSLSRRCQEHSPASKRPGEMPVLAEEEATHILNSFATSSTPQAHQSVWLQRQYAPMYIHDPALARVRDSINKAYPEYAIALDIVFRVDANRVDWQCDHESLGPFEVDHPWRAISESHFVSIHFNLTQDGGALTTLPWPILSYLFHRCIAYFGIFSHAHLLLMWLCSPVFRRFARSHPNTPRHGNVFDNMRLHSVTEGSPRISYVVRLIRRRCVSITHSSVQRGIARSAVCAAFQPLLSVVSDEPRDAASVPWSTLSRGDDGAERVRRS